MTLDAAASRLVRFVLRTVAMAMATVYVFWNGYHLVHGLLPPSLMLALFRLPSPTTGMTRGLMQLSRGDVVGSLAWHPLAVPLAGLFAVSLAWLAGQALSGRRLVLPPNVGRLWLILLVIGWVWKFATGPAYW